MPHVSIEATPRLAREVDWPQLFGTIHKRLSANGHGELDDFKSRVVETVSHLAGNDPDGEFAVARLITTNPRPAFLQRVMAQIVHDVLRDGIEAAAGDYWWQCCVLNEPFDRADYFKTTSEDLDREERVALTAPREE